MYCSKCSYSEFSNGVTACHYMGEEILAPCQVMDIEEIEMSEYEREKFMLLLNPVEEIDWDDEDFPF